MPSSSNLNAAFLFRVDGIVAVITGGGTGIGLTMARALAQNGARRVYLLGRRLKPLEDATALHPTIFTPIQCDVTSHSSLQSAVDRITAETGYINLLIANAGITGPITFWNPTVPVSEVRADFLRAAEFRMKEMNDTFAVNTTGAFFTMVAFLELLDAGNRHALSGEPGAFGAPAPAPADSDGKKKDRAPKVSVPLIQSQVIVMGSIAAYSRMFMSTPAYAGSKAAVVHLTKQASSCLAGYGIRANALAPGLFPTELSHVLVNNRDPGTEGSHDLRFIPARRFGTEEEMAGTLLYLASRAGAYCNGMVLVVDGGRSGVMLSSY